MPPGQYISETTTQQTRPIDHILDTKGRNDPEVREEISRMRSRESLLILASQVDAAEQLLPVSQWDHRNTRKPGRPGANQLVVTC